jgi:hypothetical protein
MLSSQTMEYIYNRWWKKETEQNALGYVTTLLYDEPGDPPTTFDSLGNEKEQSCWIWLRV